MAVPGDPAYLARDSVPFCTRSYSTVLRLATPLTIVALALGVLTPSASAADEANY